MLSKFTSSALLLASLTHAIQLSASADLDSSWESLTGSADATEYTLDQYKILICYDEDKDDEEFIKFLFEMDFDHDQDGVCSREEYEAVFPDLNAIGWIDLLLDYPFCY